ncbi:MAG: glycosyltransferase family 2 protein [Planctomycetes bacterium]|nr:glycosyltransferase family 2 protein [Planctomycetota bacterium]
MRVLIPLCGDTPLDDDQPVALVQVFNKTILEYVLGNLPFGDDARFVFVVKQKDCQKHHLDAILTILEPGCSVVRALGPTKGQLCSCLMGIEHIADDEPLLIVNGNQFLYEDVTKIVAHFAAKNADAGIVTFPNVHPRWSYVRTDEDGETVLETSEKRPISRQACAGIFWFARGADFIDAAKRVIRKQTEVGGQYYVSSTFNELILDGKRVLAHEIESDSFRGLHTKDGVDSFIVSMQDRSF